MNRLRCVVMLIAVTAILAGSPVLADDGEKTIKDMSHNTKLTVLPEEVGVPTAEAEHAFIDMMMFYVPSQAASGLVGPVEYNNADDALVETLVVSKPLISVFINGPAIGVEATPFAHSFMDTFAAVSLDDGATWKPTNLSESADQSSFLLGQSGGGGGGSGGGSGNELPSTHTESEHGVLHAPGMKYPYTNQCTSCHGPTLLGGEGPSCYSCHDKEWKESLPAGSGVVIITEATWEDKSKDRDEDKKDKIKGELEVEGEGAAAKAEVLLVNGVTDEIIATTKAKKNGEFEFELEIKNELPPCTVKVYSDGIASLTVTVVDDDGEAIEGCEGEPVDLSNYPGGVHNVFHATQGNKVLVAWPSRYCQQGKPAYALKNDEERLNAIVSFIQTGQAADDTSVPALGGFNLDDDLYLVDAFGVAGSQGSIDFADEGYPQAGEVPFGCVWTSRGVLLPGDDPRTDEAEASHMVWTKAERLTSGRRDPFRIEVKAVKDAGFVITWQEDPEGLRPGQGLGPGEGWSGAVAHSQTDVWYSFINWEYFDYVDNGEGAPINMVNHDLTTSGRPQVFVPMAIPMRLTNNAKCNTDGTSVTDPDLYCNFEGTDEIPGASAYGLKDQCADSVEIPTGPNNTPTPICVSEDGLPNVANTASTRPRTSLQGRDSDGDGLIDSAWVVVAAEESKGLGKFFYEPDGTPCIEGSSPTCTEEIGKNQWYFSFDMGSPDTSADLTETGLVKNLVNQGNMLNQPEVDWRTGEFYPVMDTADMWGFGDYDFEIYNTEIARRSSLLVQSIAKATASTSGLLAIPSWKQGAMRQGGPADTMLRRIVDQGTSENPYAFTNIVCDNWAYDDGSNPYYPDGVCLDPATNLSGVVPDTCVDSQTDGEIECPTVTFGTSTFGIGDTDPILQGQIQGEGNTMKVLTWHQCPSDGTQTVGDITAVTCDNDNRTDDFVNLRDQSWYNPLDVSKGHRGFIDGDIVMFLYAWSPNWRLNAKGSDRYELYVRRSFDGGATWQTTPSGGTASDGVTAYAGDGTVTCETYRTAETGGGGIIEPRVCYEYPAGGNEQARNVTQHQSMRITTLDPRYSPTPASITAGCVNIDDPTIDGSIMTCDDQSTLDSDVRDPSRYFMVYETGDNRTVEEGEAEPLDLFYSQAINFGDDYVVWAEAADLSVCYPSDPHDDDVPETLVGSGFCNEFDRMNAAGDTHSSEANLESNPNGSKMYGVWAQWVFDDTGEEVVESDAMARRIWWIDDYIPLDAWQFGQGSGDGTPVSP
ncbi:choice-of-anchor O protein [Kaarinaea lacus]